MVAVTKGTDPAELKDPAGAGQAARAKGISVGGSRDWPR